MHPLDPIVSRCAKQVYRHLHLEDRINSLSRPETLPLEVDKMNELFRIDTRVLEDVVKQFLRVKMDKKTIGVLIQNIDKALSTYSDDFDDDLSMDMADIINTKRNTSQSLKATEIVSTKRTVIRSLEETAIVSTKRNASPSLEVTETPVKKLKATSDLAFLNTPPASPLEYFSAPKEQSDFNIISSPSGKSKIFEKAPWTILYEIGRFIMTLKIPWAQLPFDAIQIFFQTAEHEPQNLYQTMMKWNFETRRGMKINGLAYTQLEKATDGVWAFHKKCMAPDWEEGRGKQNRMFHYSGVIHIPTGNAVPIIQLRPPKVNASNRMFRKFGQDRFLELKLGKSSHPNMIRMQMEYLLKPFLFMQRTFRFLFVKDDAIILFATEGNGLEPITVKSVIDWHMPIMENWDMTMSKYASRMALGYSNSIGTLQFKPEEIQYVDDIYSTKGVISDETCMTDGCGIISCQAMKQIMGCQATDELPCAIQGRIAGAKGIWIISPDLDFTTGCYIQIRKSQNKFKTGILQSDLQLDPLHYTFDLVKNSICVYPSFLNTQFIQCLSAGGVPTQTFVEIMSEYIHRLATVVTENKNVKILRDWIAQSGSIMSNRWELEDHTQKGLWRDMTKEEDEYLDLDDESFDENVSEALSSSSRSVTNASSTYGKINKYSGIPASLHECVVRLLDSGFDLSNAFVATRVTNVFRKVMQNVAIKYKIELAQSCTVTCVPDPTNTLKEGEVFLQLTSRRVDEKTGVRAGIILGDVIVTRNPCGLLSDVQKVKAVDCSALRMYTDIIVFSIQGKRPLAGKLSGGDYDGDIVFCSWDERIVAPFTSCEVPNENDRIKTVFEKDNRTVGQKIGAHPNAERALQECFISVALPDGTLGCYENWRTVLAEKKSLDDNDVVYLAQMCARLVDAPKQGLFLKKTILTEDRNRFAHLPHPSWFMDKKNKQRPEGKKNYKEVNDVYTVQNADCVTTMDFLHATLLNETQKFTQYSRNMFMEDDVYFKDSHIIGPWTKARQMVTQLNDPLLSEDLDTIERTVRENWELYQAQSKHYFALKQQRLDNTYDPTKYVGVELMQLQAESQFSSVFEMEEFFAGEFHNKPSLEELKSNIILCDIQVNGGRMLQSLKASFAYILTINNSKYAKYCYIVAYDAIRRIKADAMAREDKENGLSESVSNSIYKAMNLDRKWIRRLKDSNMPEDPDKKPVRLSPLKDS